MFKTIFIERVDGKEEATEFLANAATPRRYKQVFGGDLLNKFKDANTEVDGVRQYNIDFLPELAYIMAMQAAAKSDPNVKLDKLNEESFYAWLEQFESFSIESNAEEIIDVYFRNMEGGSEAKKNNEEQNAK